MRSALYAVLLLCVCATPAAAGEWTQRALGLQYELGSDMPLRNAPWVGTHNSFNSVAEMGPTLSDMDSNQQLALTDQLDLGIRSLELDLHWFPSVQGGGFAPVVCHAAELHAGCTVEKPLATVLGEIKAWLDANPRQVLLLYLEDHLDGQQGYDAAAAALDSGLGSALYRPPGGGAACAGMPLDLTRASVRAAGAQVVAVSGCGSGSAWPGMVFDFSRHEETRPRGFQDFPGCGPDYDRATYDTEFVRYYEDSTRLTATASQAGAATKDDGITPATAAAMARCGVDLFGLDQLATEDERLDALVWSWAPGEPAARGDCAVQGADARWRSRTCSIRRRAACRSASGTWSVTRRPVRPAEARRACRSGTPAVPRTGYEAQLLRLAASRAHAREVWLGYRRSGAGWRALDRR